jgi:hypothetical protein
MQRPRWFLGLQLLAFFAGAFVVLIVGAHFTVGLDAIADGNDATVWGPGFLLIGYLFVWQYIRTPLRTRANARAIELEFEQRCWADAQDRVRAGGHADALERLGGYSEKLFVRRAYAVRNAAWPHPFADGEYFRRMTVDVLPLAEELAEDDEAAEWYAHLGEQIAAVHREAADGATPAKAGPVARTMDALQEWWDGDWALETAAEEIVAAGFDGMPTPLWARCIPGATGWISEFQDLRAEGKLERSFTNFYGGGPSPERPWLTGRSRGTRKRKRSRR